MYQLANAQLRIAVSDRGSLLAVENRLATETYEVAADEFSLQTDLGLFSNEDIRPIRIVQARDHLTFSFAHDTLRLDLVYRLDADSGFFRRSLHIDNSSPIRLLNLTLGRTRFKQRAEEAIHYLTFWMAPTVEFIRYRRGGLFTGIENPFYRAALTEDGVTLEFEPGLILQAGEGYESEAQFVGVYRKSGVLLEDSGRPFRYPNGSGHIPIDRNESRAMRAFALDYLQPAQHRFLNINYQFFHPLPQMPHTDADVWYFEKTIGTFAGIGGNMIIFKPLHRHRKPDAETPYWNVLPEDPGAAASRIAAYAATKGVGYGFYLGIAGGHGEEGNAAGLPFRPEMIHWKKLDAAGRRAPDNCVGCDDFFTWWLQVHDNTIKRYDLRNWSWDPSMGSAMNCYDETHGHVAGKGAYKGWRRCIELARRLKEGNPGLFLQGFYGTKQFGLWGLRHTDQHEAYNEQTAIVCTHHSQISDDRQNADGLRFQNYWSMRFRFLPAVIGHAVVHRMSEGEFDPELIKAWDFYGWRYGLLSALAVSGSVMPAILPVESDLVPGYREFYQKWSRWAAEHFDYVRCTEPFGEQVQPGSVDGYARIKGDHGFLFLFNGNPRPAVITFEVGDEINLQHSGSYELVELYPLEGRRVLDDHGQSVFSWGKTARLTLPANACQVLELRCAAAPQAPLLAGLSGRTALDQGSLALTEIAGLPGRRYPLRVRLPPSAAVHGVTVNGVAQHFTRIEDTIVLDVQFAGDLYPRELDTWTTPDGRTFAFPYHEREDSLTIAATVRLPPAVADLLAAARPKNCDEMDERIAGWQESGEPSYSYHNFVGCRPHRLWLVLPFTLQKADALAFPGDFTLGIAVNGVDVGVQLKQDPNSNSFYVDITDLVQYDNEGGNHIELTLRHLGRHEFMGPFLLYGAEALTEEVLPEPQDAPPQVIYTLSLLDPLPPRYIRGGDPPRITAAWVTGNVTLTQPTQLRVQVDRPPAGLREVLYTHSGFPWMGKLALQYDAALACWAADVQPGARAAIQESEYIHVWAVGAEGLYSDYCPVKVGWDFEDRVGRRAEFAEELPQP